MAGLKARRLQTVPSSEGIQGDVVLTEPNGE
jgi:hypothetical protein